MNAYVVSQLSRKFYLAFLAADFPALSYISDDLGAYCAGGEL